jgi:hypothetical protein
MFLKNLSILDCIKSNIFEELIDEIITLKKNFKLLLGKICVDHTRSSGYINLVVNTFQRIYQILNQLKNKQILISTREYFESEIQRNYTLEEQLKENSKISEEILRSTCEEFEEAMKSHQN